MERAPLTKEEWLALEKKANDLRHLCLQTTVWAGSGHIGGGMSVMDILTVMYHRYLNIKKEDPKWEDRDRFILSKGHAGIAYAPVLCDFGYNDPEQLKTFNLTNSKMGIHLDSNKVAGVDASTGSLGQGLACAVGMAMAGKMDHKDYKVFCVVGDGEAQEGEIWEAANTAHKYGLDNLIVFVDYNNLQLDGTCDEIMPNGDLGEKFKAFGWETLELDGHSMEEIVACIDKCYASKNGKPKCLYAHTVKGKGVSFMENQCGWHGVAPNDEQYAQAMAELKAQLID
jgi:transketolase